MKKLTKVKKLIVHHTGVSVARAKNQNAESIRKAHKNRKPEPFSDIGYHRVILRNGTIENGRDEKFQGAHTKENKGNYYSLGVVLIGSFVGKEKPTTPQINSLVRLLVYWCRKHGLKVQVIYGHKDFGNTICPGSLYNQLPDIRGRVRRILAQYEFIYSIKDRSVRDALIRCIENNGKISFKEVHHILFSTFDSGISQQEINDIKTILKTAGKKLEPRSRMLIQDFLKNPKAFQEHNQKLGKKKQQKKK